VRMVRSAWLFYQPSFEATNFGPENSGIQRCASICVAGLSARRTKASQHRGHGGSQGEPAIRKCRFA